ncbi:hypothetical protein [Candidatus Endomicrobiellum pyrsonymphae]|uniref:hypothetical protein n=1 Tax=Candidatus Endomicrobiellum pyrsonymphae TaxID=1408203 RepID=UPI0035A8A3FB
MEQQIFLSLFLKGGRNSYSQNRKAKEERYHSDYEGKQYNLELKIRIVKEIRVKSFASYEYIILDVNSYLWRRKRKICSKI